MERTKWPGDMRSKKKHPTGGGRSAMDLGLTELAQLGPADATTSKPMDVMGAPICEKHPAKETRRGNRFTFK